MELEFLPHGTGVPMGVGTELGVEAFAQGVVMIDTMRGAIRLGG